MRWTRLCQGMGLLGLALFLATTLTPLANGLYRWSDTTSDVHAADAIVVLGASVDPDGTLSCDSLIRTVKAIGLFRDGRAGMVVFSGTPMGGGPSEAAVRAQLAQSLGVPSNAILTESTALTTREEAIRIGATLRARDARQILLVTASQHMRRARALFERAGLRVFPVTADARSGIGTSPGGRLSLMRDLLGEWLALGYYRLAGYI